MYSRTPLAALLLLLALFAVPAAAQSSLPPTPAVKLAVNPLTDKVYMANESAGTVTVLDAANGTTSTIAVGAGPRFVAVNPVTNRIYVDNAGDATLSVIDGATDTLIDTYGIGSSGPITVNPVTNVMYIVRMTGLGSDEVTFFSGDTNTWYTIATNSFQPNAMAVDPANDTIYVTHYGTGDVRVISGAFDPSNDFPPSTSIGTGPHPYAVAINPVTNKVYVISDNTTGPILVIDGANNGATFPTVAAGHATGPQSIAVNPVTNKAYAAFSNEVIVIDGATNALTYVPITGASTGAIAIGIDTATNRIYAAAVSGTLSVIDGDTDTVIDTRSIPSGTSSIAVNPLTGTAWFFDTALASLAGSGTPHAVPLATSITPLPGDTSPPSGSITLDASSGFAPFAMPIRGVYYRLDTKLGPWALAAGSGPYTASFGGLAPGAHTLYAFAADGQDAMLSSGPQSIPLVGGVASYTFTVPNPKTDPSISLGSSANPSVAGESVTFTVSVTGSSGQASGTVTFLDGSTALCVNVTLASGAAGCTTGSLTVGTHSITARYSGDSSYNAATSSALGQAVQAPKAVPTVAIGSSANPSNVGAAVTFTASVSGNAGTPTGKLDFLDGSTPIAGCSGIALSGASASCTTSSLSAGTHSIVAHYSGDSTYEAAASSSLSEMVSDPNGADLSVAEATSLQHAETGRDLVITLTVANAGPGSASSVAVANPIPAGSDFVWASSACDNASAIVTCRADSLAAGASLSFQLVVRPTAAGSIANEASASASQSDPNDANNTASLNITVDATPAANLVVRYRLYNDGTKEHLYTTDLNEYNVLGASGGWVQEGTVGKVLDNPGSFNGVMATPYYRLYNDQTFWHHWTTDANEYYTLIQFPNWHGEGVDGYILPTATTGATQLYRLNYPFLPGLHHWTIDANEYNTLTTQYGWIGEGGTGFVIE